LDVFAREYLVIEVSQSLKGGDMDLWAYHNRVQIDFSRPGKPTDNAYVESFNETLRAGCLDVHWFANFT
jgi:transposase InsO family protein